MKKLNLTFRATLTLGAALIGPSVLAQEASSGFFPMGPGTHSVSVQAALLHGASLSISQKINQVIDARLILNPEQTLQKLNVDSGGFSVHAKPKLGYYGLFADWYIKESAWRLTAGVASTSNSKIEIDATKSATVTPKVNSDASGLHLTLGDKTYTAKPGSSYTTADGTKWTVDAGGKVRDGGGNEITSGAIEGAVSSARLNTRVKWPSVMPYLGFGYNSNHGDRAGWAFVADVGVFVGRPKVEDPTFTNSCNTNACQVLNQELNNQATKTTDELRDKMNKLPVLPKIAIGVEYRF